MALTTRTITNQTQDHAQTLSDEQGSPLVGVKVQYVLCDSTGAPLDSWDQVTGARIAPRVCTCYTDDNGEFEIPLWPTSRGKEKRFYKCVVPEISGIAPVIAPLLADITSISWYDWMMGRDVQRIFAQNPDTQGNYELVCISRMPVWRLVSFSTAIPNVEQFTIQDGSTGIYYQLEVVGEGFPIFRPVPGPKPYHSIRLVDETDGVVCSVNLENGQPFMRPEAT